MKAAEHFTDYRYRTRSGVSVRFSVRSANVEQNDVKGKARFYFPLVGEVVWDAERRALEVPSWATPRLRSFWLEYQVGIPGRDGGGFGPVAPEYQGSR